MSFVQMPLPVQVTAGAPTAPSQQVKPMQMTPMTPQTGAANGIAALADALIKAKRASLLSNKLPGTTAQSLGLGTGMSDAGAPAAAFNADAGPMNA